MDPKELDKLNVRYQLGEFELFEVLEREYSELFKENPSDFHIVHSYGYLFESRGRHYLKRAEQIYESLLFNSDSKSELRIDGQLMYVRNALGKNKESIELYKKRVLEYPDEPIEYNYLALAYLYADQVQEAKKVIDTVEKICNDDSRFTEIAGNVYARIGDFEKALEYWDKSVKDQFSMGGWFSRAFTFKDLGRLEEAAAEWRRIIKMLEEYHDSLHLEWPKEELAKIEAMLKEKNNINL